MARSYTNLYDGASEGGFREAGAKGAQDECDPLKAYDPHINPTEICTKGYCYPTDLPEIIPSAVSNIWREFAKRWAVVDVDTSDLYPTQTTAFNYITTWAICKSQSDDA